MSVVPELKRVLESHFHPDHQVLRFRVCTYGDDFELHDTVREAIKARIRDATAMLVICTPSAAVSPYVEEEVKTFVASHGHGKLLAGYISEAAQDFSTKWFARDTLAVNLIPSVDMSLGEWRSQLRREGNKLVARVWDLPLERVFDRFKEQVKKQRRSKVLVAAVTFLVLLVAAAGYSTSVGFHPTQLFEGNGTGFSDEVLGFPRNDNRLVTLTGNTLHLWSFPADTKEIIPFQGLANRAALFYDDKVLLAIGQKLVAKDLVSKTENSLLEAQGNIDALSVCSGEAAFIVRGHLFFVDSSMKLREAPKPVVVQGRNFPTEVRTTAPLFYGQTLAWSPDCTWLAIASFTGQLVLINASNLSFLTPDVIVYEANDSRPISGLVFEHLRSRLLFWEGSTGLRSLDLQTKSVRPILNPSVGVINHAALLPNDSYLVASSPNKVNWFVRKGEQYVFAQSVDDDPLLVTGVSVSPSGKYIATSGPRREATIYQRTARLLRWDLWRFER